MPKRKNYASYDPRIKAAVASSGRVDLFPELRIPRTTALHWIKTGYVVDDPVFEMLTSAINAAREDADARNRALFESRAMTVLLKEVLEIMDINLRWSHVDSVDARNKILLAISTAMETARRSMCLETLGLSLSRYKRWRRERRGCGLPDTEFCPKGRANQLTFQEIQLMRELVTSVEFAHFPIRSLHHYARREGLLYCTYSTWRKYIDQYGWLRPRKKRFKKKSYRIGIRAKRPNEIWHMDVSYFILPDESKCFIQAIIDNYSRYVLAWQVMESFDGAKTASLLQTALTRSIGLKLKGRQLKLIVDGGGENKSEAVNRLESRGHFKKQVARFEISFSNSIVEALFRSLKHNYLYNQDIKTYKSLSKHTGFWFSEHNDRIPHTAFSGETPSERFNQSRNKEEEIRIMIRHEDAVRLRIKHNQQVSCQLCEVA